MIIILLHGFKNRWECHLLYTVCQVSAISTTSALGESAGLEKCCFISLHMDHRRDISPAVAVAIRVRQHSSFSLLIAPKESKVRILWSMTPNWDRKSGFISWLEFKAHVRIWTSCLSPQSFCFLFHSCCVACLYNKLFKVVTATYRTLIEYLGHGSNTGIFDQYKNNNPFFFSVFSLTFPENLGVSSVWESSGYTFDRNHWKFLQPNLFCSWSRSLQSGFSAFMENAQGKQG